MSPQAIAIEIADALPGCTAERFALEGNTVLTGRVLGHGPSLHRTGMTWAATPATLDRRGIAAAFSRHVKLQERRHAAARRLGFSGNGPGIERLDHLLVDRMLRHQMGSELFEEVRQVLGKLKTFAFGGKDDRIRHGGVVLRDGDLTGSGSVRPTVVRGTKTAWGFYDGERVSITGEIPASLVGSLAGRKVGDVIDAGAAEPKLSRLSDRTILSAEVDEGGLLVLTTEADWVGLAAFR